MAENAKILIEAEDRSKQGFESAKANLRGLMDDLGSMKGLLGGIAVGAIVADLGSTITEFERLKGQLRTVTGSADNAAIAFQGLEAFAKNTPFALDQSVTAFTRLVALGLTPSERALMSYGNTASAMGKDLMQMVEAVADATSGEFERLKEFGIKASAQGDQVKFTFQGVTTSVANNAQAIEQYLMSIGETKFGDAMAAQMDSLPGALSNLKDEFDSLWRTVGDEGATNTLTQGVHTAIEVLGQLKQTITFTADTFKGGAGSVDVFSGALDVVSFTASRVAIGVSAMATIIKTAGQGIGAFAAAVTEAMRGNFAGAKDIFGSFKDDAVGNVDSLAAQIDRLSRGSAPAAKKSNLPALESLVPTQPRTASTASTANKSKKTGGARDEYGSALVGMERELAMIGDLSKAEEMLWETQHGRYKNLSAAQKSNLVDMAEEIDFRKADQAAMEGAARAGQEWYEQSTASMAELKAQTLTDLNDLQTSLLGDSDQQLIALEDKYISELDLLRSSWDQKLVTEQEYMSLREQLEEVHQNNINKVRMTEEKRSTDYIRSLRMSVVSDFANFLDVMAGKNKAVGLVVLAIQKGLAIAETFINTQVASMRALAELGPVAGPVAAAAIEKLGFIKMGLIAATGIAQAAGAGGGGGGGAVPVYNASPNSGNPSPQGPGYGSGTPKYPPTVQVNLGDDDTLISAGAVRKLIEKINEAIGDGAQLVIA